MPSLAWGYSARSGQTGHPMVDPRRTALPWSGPSGDGYLADTVPFRVMQPLRASHSLIVVSGKGGVGKSALAASIARLSARSGRKTVLVSLDTRDERHPFFDVALTYRPQAVAERLFVSRVDAFESIADYARSRMPMAALYEGFFKTRAFRDFATAAPGFDELMCLGRLYNLAVESEFERVVFDAPATGHLRSLLEVPTAVQRAVQVGPINHVAGRIRDLLLDAERTHVFIAALAEELPVGEALELVALCRDELRMSVGPILVNRRIRAPFSEREWSALRLLDGADSDASALLRQAIGLARREMDQAQTQAAALEPLLRADLSIHEIPRIVLPVFDRQALLQRLDQLLEPLVGAPG